MIDPQKANTTALLIAWGKGDQKALEALTPRVQAELHRLAAHYMAGERQGHLLQTTALVNEAYLRLVDWKGVEWADRAHFFAIAANMMRRVLVDYARSNATAKRGAGAAPLSLAEVDRDPLPKSTDLVALDQSLYDLERIAPRQSKVVELRYFGGLSLEEIAGVMNVSVGTVRHDWSLARAWLFRALSRKENP
ncbi:MAG TPA: sigma-70 family RNA polymerase sigma factor [Bryobacteraceae bacterium]|nr:sigma-70 family RNA polymerase sigma factor [Bryobacteraceae bacterium]